MAALFFIGRMFDSYSQQAIIKTRYLFQTNCDLRKTISIIFTAFRKRLHLVWREKPCLSSRSIF